MSQGPPRGLPASTTEGVTGAPGVDGVDGADPEADKGRTASRRLLALIAGLLDGDAASRRAAEGLLAALR